TRGPGTRDGTSTLVTRTPDRSLIFVPSLRTTVKSDESVRTISAPSFERPVTTPRRCSSANAADVIARRPTRIDARIVTCCVGLRYIPLPPFSFLWPRITSTDLGPRHAKAQERHQ